MSMRIIKEDVKKLVDKEIELSTEKYGLFKDGNHGYGVLLEEYEELQDEIINLFKIKDRKILNRLSVEETTIESLWDLIKSNNSDMDIYLNEISKNAINIACEAIQVAAMCNKFKKCSSNNII